VLRFAGTRASRREERSLPGPTWLTRALGAAMIAVALYHAARMVRTRKRTHPFRYDVDLTHLGMGVVMALMLGAALRPPWSAASGMAFAVPAAWFGWRSMRAYVLDGARAALGDLPHALACAAMLCMLAASAVPGADMAGMSMPGTSGSSVVGVALVVLMVGVAIGSAARLRQLAGPPRALARGCELAMGSTMVYMLAAML
jgi:hypothetical protein